MQSERGEVTASGKASSSHRRDAAREGSENAEDGRPEPVEL